MKLFCSRVFYVLICFSSPLMAIPTHAQNNYQEEIEQWHQKRIADLKSENGWLNIVGLYWISPGRNTFGSGDEVAIKFPKGAIPAYAGYFELKDGTVKLVVQSGVNIAINGKPVQEAVVFHEDSARPAEARYGDLKWTIIKREDKFGIRLRHLKSPALSNFKEIERYPVNTAWRVNAVLQPASLTAGISITNVLGQTTVQASPGKLVFSIGGKTYTLDALDGGKDELFIIFGDKTNGVETYPSGRYIYVKRPGPDGVVVLDFNKAYNPPCAFTNYATCPLPPRQNILPLAITAGEKNYGTHK